MKKIILINIICLFVTPSILYGQNISTKDSIANFYNDFISNLKSDYLKRKDVRWDEIESYAIENAIKSKSFDESLKITTLVFDTIGCNHCHLFSENGSYGSTLNKSLTQDDFSKEFILKYESQPPLEVKLINENIGYIQMPAMLMIDLTQDSLNKETQKMYDKIAALAKKNRPVGWIVDLRFNTGGNVYPMLASLHYLLGNSVVYKEQDANGNISKSNTLKDGSFYSGDKLEAKAEITMEPDLEVPVAIITGKMTGSSGEDIAVAFKNRENTVFIGEKSYGLLTGNDLVELPYDTKLALTICYIVDSNDEYREYINPDIIVSKKDNFKDLNKDENIIKALDFFSNVKD